MEDLSMQHTVSPVVKVAVAVISAAVVTMAGVSYAVHEHHAAERLAAQNQQANSQLTSTRSQVADLTARVNAMIAQQQQEEAARQAAAERPVVHRLGKPRAGRVAPSRWRKMQAQLDKQEQEIQETRGDLTSTSTQLSGSIARTHAELVVLEAKGQRNYVEFDLYKDKQFRREGPVGVSLRKANVKHQFANLQLLVDDRSLTEKHVNLDQPVMFYTADSEKPIEVVINVITKNHIHGYVSAPKYGKSDLASMADAAASGNPNPMPQATGRRVLTPQ
jgi:hypothetical protein